MTDARASPRFATQAASPDGAVTRRTWRGREYAVAPAVLLVEGVHQCATCPTPELYLASEFGHWPDTWNGRPVTLQHPRRGEEYISANAQETLDEYQVGAVYGASLDGTKLKGEAWIDIARVTELGPEAEAALAALENGDQMEVSTGYFCDVQDTRGSFNGDSYEGIQRNVVPDHLALLPGGQGACNWADGCGVPRTNQKGDAPVTTERKGLLRRIKDMLAPAPDTNGRPDANAEGMSDSDTRRALESALTTLTGGFMNFAIREVFAADHTVIYQTANGENDYGWNGPMYEATYASQPDGTVSVDNVRQVVRKVSYDTVPAEEASASAGTSGASAQSGPSIVLQGDATTGNELRVQSAPDTPSANGDCGCPDRPAVNYVPANVSTVKAPKGQAWTAPALKDFPGDKSWASMTAAERRRVAEHYAYAPSSNPMSYNFGDLKLPHHDPSNGHVVWRGVAAAAATLQGSRGGVDIPSGQKAAVRAHLAAHYHQFDEVPPWEGSNNVAHERVNALVASGAFTDGDRPWLEALDEDQLGRIEANAKTPSPTPESAPPEGAPTANVDEAVQRLAAIATPEAQDAILRAVNAEKQRKADLVASIEANERNAFTKDELQAMTAEQLAKLDAAIQPVDYSGANPRGIEGNRRDDDTPPPMPPVLGRAPAGEGN